MTTGPMADIRRVRAANASALTGSGTNTYLLGRGDVAVIDPGPADADHLAAILRALEPGERISHILVTHAHLDHSALARPLQAATGATVAGFGRASEGRSAVMQRLAEGGLVSGGEGLDTGFSPDIRLRDADVVQGQTWRITALHTPGHLGGHLCFACGDVLFSGDHVMAWSSSIVSPPDGDMADYRASMARLAQRPWHRFLPGHGEAVEAPAERLAGLMAHRARREAQILAALPRDGADATALARHIYTGIAPELMAAASRNVLAHLVELASKNRVTTAFPVTPESRFFVT